MCYNESVYHKEGEHARHRGGIAERAGRPIAYVYFLKQGSPALLLTVALALIWLLIRFLVL